MKRLFLAAFCAFVLVGCKGKKEECKTPCDCKPGYDCASGQCLSGTVAVFCCNACPPTAPPGQGCVHPDGRRDSCGVAPAPKECAGQPCCGDPPMPCGEWIERQKRDH
jgi:hypothetical protein